MSEAVITELDFDALTDDDIAALNVFENAMLAEEHPDDPPRPFAATEAETRHIPEFIGYRQFWAREADSPIAGLAYGFWTKDVEENRYLLRMALQVHRDHRRRGIGRELLRRMAVVADAERRDTLMFGTSDRIRAGEVFARRVGAKPAFAAHTNRLVLSGVDLELVERWVSEGPLRASGYSLFAVDGPYPDDLIEAAADLMEVMNTAPREDLEMEDEHITPEQIRERERTLWEHRTQRWVIIARHDGSGELAGYTEVMWNEHRPQTVSQGDTGVRPEHRGHALGKWLKAAMLRRVLDERPEAVDIRTGNADSNEAMLGINHALGFEPYLAATWWNVKVDQVRAYLAAGSSV